jgi:VIT1/CCC1 family predicted Fe2+/Mn2+ transporter
MSWQGTSPVSRRDPPPPQAGSPAWGEGRPEVQVRVDAVMSSGSPGKQHYRSLSPARPQHASSQHNSDDDAGGGGGGHDDDEDETASLCPSHAEPHFGSAEVVRDIIVGLSDGLTVPFALAAGLAALNNTRLVVTAGLAEIVAGSISMGVGGYLAGMSEIEHYTAERKREAMEVELMPEREIQEIREIFSPYGMNRAALEPMLEVLANNKEAWIDFMMKFELNMEKPDKHRAWISAITIGFSYLLGGMVPLVPYMLIESAYAALWASVFATVLALFLFGYIKAHLFGIPNPLQSALQMAAVGSLAAGAAFGIARLIPPAF